MTSPSTSARRAGTQARFMPAAVAKAVQYAQVEALLTERNSQRRQPEALELDEM